jgi:hypothetical protein
MIELARYFRILFLSVRISRDRLRIFTEAHIQALTNNNPGGIFTAILTAVTNAYNAYFGDLASRSLNEAVKQAKTQARDISRENLQKNISENEALVKYTYRNTPDVYQEFYPFGVDEYHQADVANYVIITERYRQALANHAGDFTPAFVTAYNNLHTTFMSNFNAQLAAVGDIYTEISELQTSRQALATQLTINLLTIALQYVGDESKADVYFRQDILDAAFKESERRVTNEINPGELQNAFENVTTGDQNVTLKNDGETDLVAGFTDTLTGVPTLVNVPMGNEVTKNAAEWGWTSEKKFFNISNGTTIAGKYTASRG